MKKISIVPDLIYSEYIVIKDNLGIPVELTDDVPAFVSKVVFKNPFIIIDNFEKMKSKNLEIIKIDVQNVERLGFRLVAVRCTPKTRWYSGQSKIYVLEQKNNPIPKSEYLTTIPKEHVLEHDLTNNRIRIRGKMAGYPHIRTEIAGRWITL